MEEPYYQEQFGFVEDESVKSSNTTDSEIDNYLANLDNRPEELDISSEKLDSSSYTDSDSSDRPPKEKPFPKTVNPPIKKNKPKKVTKLERKNLEYRLWERKQKAKSCCRSVKNKEYSASKTKKIIAGLVWLEIILIILIWIISFVWAYVLTDVGEIINEAFDINDNHGVSPASYIFGGICWVVIYCIGLGLNIYYRCESIEIGSGDINSTIDILKYVGHAAVHVGYFLIRFPIFFAMVYYSIDEGIIVNKDMFMIATWMDVIIVGLLAIIVVIISATMHCCCKKCDCIWG